MCGSNCTVGSNPTLSALFRNEPFGENVEGLSHDQDGSCTFRSMFKTARCMSLPFQRS
jgi:hypothetical protein